MDSLVKELKQLEKSSLNKKIEERLKEFESFKNKNNEDWFSELCFCILTANAKQKTAEAIQKEIGYKGFMNFSLTELTKSIIKNKHRFHNNKAKYIFESRRFHNIKEIIQQKTEHEARDWIVSNIKGLGMKEASHFLRNTGTNSLAILDRHILKLMHEEKIITRPKSLNKKSYLEIEKKFLKMSEMLNITPAKLDLMMWYLKTGEIAK